MQSTRETLCTNSIKYDFLNKTVILKENLSGHCTQVHARESNTPSRFTVPQQQASAGGWDSTSTASSQLPDCDGRQPLLVCHVALEGPTDLDCNKAVSSLRGYSEGDADFVVLFRRLLNCNSGQPTDIPCIWQLVTNLPLYESFV